MLILSLSFKNVEHATTKMSIIKETILWMMMVARKYCVDYFSGMYMLLRDAPMPGRPWRTLVMLMAYSPR